MKLVKKKSDISDKIVPIDSLGLTIAALFYGRAGTGKTTLASSFPKPLLHLDIREKGTDSIADVKEADTINIVTFDEFEEVYWHLCSKPKYKTVIIDTISQVQDIAIDKAKEEEGKEKDDAVSQRLWGAVSGKMKTWIMNYRDLIEKNIHVVFIAHDRTTDVDEGVDQGEIAPFIGPRLMPSVAGILTASVKIIGNTFIKESHKVVENKKLREVKYCMRIGPHAYYTTKIRQPKGSYTPDIIVDPDYDKLVQIMKGEFASPKLKGVRK